MAKIHKPIFACFGIQESCQFLHFQRLPKFAKYNFVAHFGINSGSFDMLMFAILGKNFNYFYTFIYQLT